MTTSFTRYADIDSYVHDIKEGSLFTLRQTNVLVSTVTVFNDTMSMAPRRLYEWGKANPRQVGEGEAVSPTNFSKALKESLVPARYADTFILTDQRMRSDWEAVRDAAVMELGSAFAQDVDSKIAGLFTSLTGGTVGSGGSLLNWSHILQARARLGQKGVPGPYFCVLGHGQWYHLINNGGTANASTFMRSEAFQDRVINNYFVSSLFGDVIFAITGNVSGAAGGTAYGAMYSPMALAYDERSAYGIEPARNANRKAWELNANMEYAYGVWDKVRGIQLVGKDDIS